MLFNLGARRVPGSLHRDFQLACVDCFETEVVAQLRDAAFGGVVIAAQEHQRRAVGVLQIVYVVRAGLLKHFTTGTPLTHDATCSAAEV